MIHRMECEEHQTQVNYCHIGCTYSVFYVVPKQVVVVGLSWPLFNQLKNEKARFPFLLPRTIPVENIDGHTSLHGMDMTDQKNASIEID
jgi:hypothetical protein